MKRLIILLLFILNNSFSQNTSDETITIFDKSVLNIIDQNARIEILGDDFAIKFFRLMPLSSDRLWQ